jgi:aldehyde:ferredoxin oxidoreductase
MQTGSRIQTLKQAFNVRHGIEPLSFAANPRSLGLPPQTSGANKGRTVPIEPLTRDYYSLMGWDPDSGKPTADCLSRLGLD